VVAKPYSQGAHQWIKTILSLQPFWWFAYRSSDQETISATARRFCGALTDEEVVTMEICGGYFKLECDKDIFTYFRKHYLHFSPKLTDRSLFVRQAANLWQVKAAIQKRLVIVSGRVNDPLQVIDTLSLPTCVLTRAMRDRGFKTEADFGYCAAKDLHDYGFNYRR
jgi:hypothetical protein